MGWRMESCSGGVGGGREGFNGRMGHEGGFVAVGSDVRYAQDVFQPRAGSNDVQ